MRPNELSCITLDAPKVAEGLWNMMSDDEQALIALGMFPLRIMECLKRSLWEKFDELAIGPLSDLTPDRYMFWNRATGITEFNITTLVNECTHYVTVELMRLAEHELKVAV